jgi:peptidoglycan/LPS O-acetylase OafA/YrhL
MNNIESQDERLHFIDNLRTWMVVLVVIQHIGTIYNTLYLLMILNSAYFMGLLFMLSGYFTPLSFEHKGPGLFFKDRMLRLGIPTIFYVFILNPIASWALQEAGLVAHKDTIFNFALGPMWFAVMLLVFDLCYMVWQMIVKNKGEQKENNKVFKLSFGIIALFTIILAFAGYLIRMILPYGLPFFGFPSPGYLFQYISFFLIGTLAFRKDLFRSITGSSGRKGFIIAIVSTLTLLPAALTLSTNAEFIGYGQWQSAIFALWDSIFAVGISFALITFFRHFLNKGKRLSQFLSRHSFTVYIIHVPVIAFLALGLSGLELHQLVKVILSIAIGIPLCFGVAWIIFLVPFVKKIL